MQMSDEVRAFLEEPHHCVMGTINSDGTAQLTTMWYDLVGDMVVLNTTRGLVKERNLRRDPRMSICVSLGQRSVTLSGRAELIEDRGLQEQEVAPLATRYIGRRLGEQRWALISSSDRVGIHLHVERIYATGFN